MPELLPIGTEALVIKSDRCDLLCGSRGTILGYHEGGYVFESPDHIRTKLFGGGSYKENAISWISAGNLTPLVNETKQ